MNPAKIIKYGSYFTVSRFTNFVRHMGKNLSFIRTAIVLYFCMRDPDTPKYIKAVIVGALGYLILPTDMVPDSIVGLGWVDDLAVITATMKLASKYIKPTHRELAKAKFPFGKDVASS